VHPPSLTDEATLVADRVDGKVCHRRIALGEKRKLFQSAFEIHDAIVFTKHSMATSANFLRLLS